MYQALYRKYRSKTFEEIVGQNHVTTALKNQIINNEFSHAYLFQEQGELERLLVQKSYQEQSTVNIR